MVKFNRLQFVLIFMIFLAQMGKSFTYARKVKEAKLVAIEKEFAVEGGSNFSLPEENLDSVPNTSQVQKSAKTGGRKMSTQAMNKNKETTSKQQESRKNKKVSVAGSRRDYGNNNNKENWKENIMAFSADYRSPKSHPPKNN